MHRTFLLKRLLLAVPTLFGVAAIVFVLLRVAPGDPISMMLPPGAKQEDIVRLRELYGLNDSIPAQFTRWLGEVARGDFGTSISLRENALKLVLSRLPATLELVFLALLIALAGGVLLAVAAARWRGRWPESVVDGIAGLVQAIPDFLWALLLILFFGVLLPLLPISGRLDPRNEFEFASQFYLIESLLRGEFALCAQLLKHLLLPALALALPLAATIARVLKGSLIDALGQDYVMLARVKGYSIGRILWRVALRNALIPTVSLTAVQFTFLIGGTVLIEHIYSYPGIGGLAINAVIQRDLPLIQCLVLTFAVLFILVNLLTDFLYTRLDPRVRQM
jgi:ABC-type dipeptide/oligopeptide/nickel transport system permease component